MVTIFFGANDICSAQCYNPKDFSPLRHAIHLRRTLDFLRTALPRTLVNLVPTIGKSYFTKVFELKKMFFTSNKLIRFLY